MKVHIRTGVLLLAVVGVLLGVPRLMVRAVAQEPRFDVNDLSYLWPAPATAADVAALIPGDVTTADGAKRIWPDPLFKLLLDTATNVKVEGSAGTTSGISFKGFEQEFAKPSTWKVVGFRVDPSAPGGHAPFVGVFGSTPQLRIIFQPVTVDGGGTIRVHDVTAHLAFSYTKSAAPVPAGTFPKAVPNEDLFRDILNDLKALKTASDAGGAATTGALRVHPGLEKKVPGFADKVKAFLQRRGSQGELADLAFMGLQPPEPWIFFAMRKRPDGAFERVPSKNLGGRDAQMLTFRGGTHVMPGPSTRNLSPSEGVSTAPLFRDGAPAALGTAVLSTAARPLHQDIPDLIANPRHAHVLNTDCVSCHTESTRRKLLSVPAGDGMFRYVRATGISGMDEGHLPQSKWNVRNFGWFQQSGKVQPTISMRTANEAAESVDFVNRVYFGAPDSAPAVPSGNTATRSQTTMSEPVASPLTLVMNIKSHQDFVELKALIEKMQSAPPDKNPITIALNELATVHFARFVFLNDRQLAVITTYDGKFDDYIDAFANAIGDVFDKLLAHVVDAPPTPVSKPENRKAFLEYVKKNDLTAMPPFYSAYPRLKVLDILTLQKQHGGS